MHWKWSLESRKSLGVSSTCPESEKALGIPSPEGTIRNDADFAVKCRMITAMAFVRPDEIIPVLRSLKKFCWARLIWIQFWHGSKRPTTRKPQRIMSPPLFAHSIWNVYDRTLNGDHRTNNFAEAANHRIQTELDVSHPGLWTIYQVSSVSAASRDQKYLQWMAGKEPKGKRQKYKQADARILRIVQDYQERETKEYLKELLIILLWKINFMFIDVCCC
uniref:Uncharacterized protein n=1 Tax=Ditylenchus dipsaci TaxID=166011 RepID=A0A915EIJ4_9BILA